MMMMYFYSAFSIISAQICFKTLCRGPQPDCIEQFTLEGNLCRCSQYRNIWTQGPTTTLGDVFATLCVKCMHSFKSTANQVIEDILYCPYPRRLEHLTICSCQSKGSTFSSAVFIKTLRVGSVWGSNSQPSVGKSSALQPEPAGNFLWESEYSLLRDNYFSV